MDRGSEQIPCLMNAIIKENKVPSDWHGGYIISLLKAKEMYVVITEG